MKKARFNLSDYSKNIRLQLRIDVLTHYGNGKCKCVKCGLDDIRALSIDHINGGGSKHIRNLKHDLYHWLKNTNYPEGYQTLCMSCQRIKVIENHEYLGRRKRDSSLPPKPIFSKMHSKKLALTISNDTEEYLISQATKLGICVTDYIIFLLIQERQANLNIKG